MRLSTAAGADQREHRCGEVATAEDPRRRRGGTLAAAVDRAAKTEASGHVLAGETLDNGKKIWQEKKLS